MYLTFNGQMALSKNRSISVWTTPVYSQSRVTVKKQTEIRSIYISLKQAIQAPIGQRKISTLFEKTAQTAVVVVAGKVTAAVVGQEVVGILDRVEINKSMKNILKRVYDYKNENNKKAAEISKTYVDKCVTWTYFVYNHLLSRLWFLSEQWFFLADCPSSKKIV